jgi:DNA (cytosine-5)-methyltransferase 1
MLESDIWSVRPRGFFLPSCIDLFSGAGGFSLAAINAGFSVKLAVENDRHAAATYRTNFCAGASKTLLLQDDISTLSPIRARELSGLSVCDCDLLLGGPPCQGFSTHRIKNAGVLDRRNDLIHVYFEFVKEFAPRVFLMENVQACFGLAIAATLKDFMQKETTPDIG